MIAAAQIANISARPFAGTRVSGARNGTRVQMAKVGNWFPGSDTPAYLDSLPASYGFGKCSLLSRVGIGIAPSSFSSISSFCSLLALF